MFDIPPETPSNHQNLILFFCFVKKIHPKNDSSANLFNILINCTVSNLQNHKYDSRLEFPNKLIALLISNKTF